MKSAQVQASAREYRAGEFAQLCRAHFPSVELFGLFHARKLRVHELALALGWDRVHRLLGVTGPFYERFTPAPRSAPESARDDLPAAPVIAPPQLRLLEVHEIDVVTAQDAPAFVGSPPQTVIRCAGPWRLDAYWFERRIVRDEYDVLLEDGSLYRIFKQGGRWYVRGAYD